MALLHFVQISYLFLFVQMCESQFSETQHGKKYYIKIVIVSRMLRKTFPHGVFGPHSQSLRGQSCGAKRAGLTLARPHYSAFARSARLDSLDGPGVAVITDGDGERVTRCPHARVTTSMRRRRIAKAKLQVSWSTFCS